MMVATIPKIGRRGAAGDIGPHMGGGGKPGAGVAGSINGKWIDAGASRWEKFWPTGPPAPLPGWTLPPGDGL